MAWKDSQVVRIPGLLLYDEFHQELDVFTAPKILTVGVKDGTPNLWALIDTNAPKVKKTVRLLYTGGPCGCAGEDYVNTFINEGLVYHVFVN